MTNKNAWLVNHYVSRPGEPATRHYSLARAMQNAEWSVSLIGSSVQHSTGEQRVRGAHLRRMESIDGVRFLWLKGNRYGRSRVRRVLNMLGFTILLLTPGATRGLPPPDVVVGSSVHPWAAWAGSRLARRHGVPFVFEIRDLWPETLVEFGALKRTALIARLMYSFEAMLCRRATKIVTLMPFASDYLAGRGVPRDKVVWISNGVWLDEFPVIPEDDFDETAPFSFVYYGSIGVANNVEVLIEGFAACDFAQPALLHVFGDGAERERLEQRVVGAGMVDRIKFHGAVPKAAIPAIAAGADCLVVAVRDSPLYSYGISLNKLFEYMAAGKPVLFAGVARGNPILDSGGGVVVEGTVEAVATGYAEVLEASYDARQEWGRRNRSHVEQEFDYRVLGERFARVLKSVSGLP